MGNMNGDPDYNSCMPPRGQFMAIPDGCKYEGGSLYAITVTDGGRSIRYEAPTAEEVKRMANFGHADEMVVEIVTLKEAK